MAVVGLTPGFHAEMVPSRDTKMNKPGLPGATVKFLLSTRSQAGSKENSMIRTIKSSALTDCGHWNLEVACLLRILPISLTMPFFSPPVPTKDMMVYSEH